MRLMSGWPRSPENIVIEIAGQSRGPLPESSVALHQEALGCKVALVNLPSHCRVYLSAYTESMRPALYLLLFAFCALSAQPQESLRQQIRAIAIEAHGQVSVACSLPGSALNCDLNPNAQPPACSRSSSCRLLSRFCIRLSEARFRSISRYGFVRKIASCPTSYSPSAEAISRVRGLMSPCASFCDWPLRSVATMSQRIFWLRLVGGSKGRRYVYRRARVSRLPSSG